MPALISSRYSIAALGAIALWLASSATLAVEIPFSGQAAELQQAIDEAPDNVTVENVKLKIGYLRGAVEVSDGTDNITVRDVYAEDARYAIDVQDHKGESAANTTIVIENAEALNCRYIIRTANSSRGHANLALRNFSGRNCDSPVQISNPNNVTIEGLKLECKSDSKLAPSKSPRLSSPSA